MQRNGGLGVGLSSISLLRDTVVCTFPCSFKFIPISTECKHKSARIADTASRSGEAIVSRLFDRES